MFACTLCHHFLEGEFLYCKSCYKEVCPLWEDVKQLPDCSRCEKIKQANEAIQNIKLARRNSISETYKEMRLQTLRELNGMERLRLPKKGDIITVDANGLEKGSC